MAKDDILKGTILWLKAMAQKPKNTTKAVAVDVALQEALKLIMRGKHDGERSAGDKAAEKILDEASQELAEIERPKPAVAKKASKTL